MGAFGTIIWESKVNTETETDPTVFDTTPNEMKSSNSGRTFVNEDRIPGTVIGDKTGPYNITATNSLWFVGGLILLAWLVNPFR